MTLLFTEGFDLTTTISTASLAQKGWVTAFTGGGGGATSVTGRFGTGIACNITKGNANGGTTGMSLSLPVTRSTLIAGLAFQSGYSAGNIERIIGFMDNGTEQLSVRYVAGGVLTISRNGTTLATQSSPTLTSTSFYYIELRVTFGTSTSGSYALRVNGAAVAGIPDASSVNTSATGSSVAGQIVLGNISPAINPGLNIYDDIYVCDSNGSVNNTFLGDVRAIGILPTSAGTNTNFTIGGSSPAATNYQSVNEATPNSDVTYVSSSVVGTTDTYHYASLPVQASQILAVVANPSCRKDDAGARALSIRVRSGGTEADSPTPIPLLTSYAMPEFVMEVDPTTSSAWTVASVNAVEIGPKVAS